MNLDMIRPKNETGELLLSITKNCESFFEQTHRKPEETLDFKLTKSRKTFHFSSPMSVESSWTIELTSLEINISIYNINHETNKIEIYTDTVDEFSFGELKGELEEIVNTSIIPHEQLQDHIIGPRIIKAQKKPETEKKQTDGFYLLLLGYTRSPF